MKKLLFYFTKGELILWFSSLFLITFSFIIFDREGYLTLIASLIGATSLIFCAKGNPIGPFLMIIFGILYGIISFSFRYYGEMITYVGMTVPMSIFSFVAWIRNPYKGNVSEVTVSRLKRKDITFMLILTLAVTVVFYFILKAFDTANLIPSTVSVATSFLAVLLTYKRSPYYALVYAANDVVLIVLWILAAMTDISYLSVIICFIAFMANDIYGFINWQKMQKKQNEGR
ncbi:MAG: nicotinamide mononucleotide transporter [Clostridia bacterium]|nr:nicotinamide mononucleotide transporter [Clostridia bacterium]